MCNFTPLGAGMSIVRFWCSRGFVSFFLFHGWCPHFTLVISLYCFVHFSYSRESNERDGTVEQDAVWTSYFLPWVGAGAGWLADLAQAFLSSMGSGWGCERADWVAGGCIPNALDFIICFILNPTRVLERDRARG
ncbi:uncharacterized protein K441DRAFT_359063 [Cenococcum geophilum 1.58]|uniref:Uncharacterized protein n=1 Tax=Cenococcum geophilum 1.58 TaxID=794803 RepID=A0ACC8ELZ4_9PEZI|nr:hypothetical protein K441DRAFT_359063 [Cenococcum geophilum 1.58]